MVQNQAMAGRGLLGVCENVTVSSYNPTVSENIDNRIKCLEVEIERLKSVKTKLEAGDIASIPISDLRNAMQY